MSNLFELQDTKGTPDIFHDYSKSVKDGKLPLIIDNGSFQCRVGWSNQKEPSLIFKNLMAKPRKEKTKKDVESSVNPPTQIGNDIINIEAVRFQLRTQFDRNVVTHFQIQEQIFDYIFGHLNIDTDKCISHPLVITECFVNPNYSRQLMSELLFECYSVPSVSYGVDLLHSFQHNAIGDNGLIVCCGYHTTHIVPVLNGKTQHAKSRRINLGGYHMTNYLHRLLQLKYPVHVNAITLSRAEELLHNHCSIATDYSEELKKWSSIDFYENHVKKIQLPFTQVPLPSTITAEQKVEKKKELSRRLVEINARKREEKLHEDEEELEKLIGITELKSNKTALNAALKELELSNIEELEKLIINIRSRIERARQKIAAAELGTPVPKEKILQIPQPPNNMPVSEWIDDVKLKRKDLLEKRQARRQRLSDLAKRRTVAAQERMRIISQLVKKDKGTDDFGMRDEDWDVYKTISRDGGDSDSEVENEKLLEYEEVLRHHDPNFEEPQSHLQGNVAENHQLHVGVESLRAAELLFQPSMMGSPEAGVAETIDYVLKMFDAEEQLLLANNVFLTGGCSKFPGLKERLSREMLEMRPFQTPHKITIARNPTLDAWFGAKDFSTSHKFEETCITRAAYDEMGAEYLNIHRASNMYSPTPAALLEPVVTEFKG